MSGRWQQSRRFRRRRRHGLTREQAARYHAVGRALERFGVLITPARYRELCDEIAEGRAYHYGDQKDGRSRWIVQIAGRDAIAVYDPDARCITTLMPAEWKEPR